MLKKDEIIGLPHFKSLIGLVQPFVILEFSQLTSERWLAREKVPETDTRVFI